MISKADGSSQLTHKSFIKHEHFQFKSLPISQPNTIKSVLILSLRLCFNWSLYNKFPSYNIVRIYNLSFCAVCQIIRLTLSLCVVILQNVPLNAEPAMIAIYQYNAGAITCA